MIKKGITILLTLALCLLTISSALGFEQHIDVYNSPGDYEKATGNKIERFSESPDLATKVAAGELPPIEERLPEKPLVIEPFEKIGSYGGMLNLSSAGGWVIVGAQDENLLKSEYHLTETIPNILERYEVSKDVKTFTLHLRKGIKWSDGVPLTTDDVLFAYEDVLLNKKLTPIFPSTLTVNGEPMKLKVIDDYTFRVSFAAPYAVFPLRMYSWFRWTLNQLIRPKHYMKRFHPRYTPLEKLEPMIKEAGYGKGEWWRLFMAKVGSIPFWTIPGPQYVGFPCLSAWVVADIPKPGVAIFERNPYYWKVDSEGNQLPYIDRIRIEEVSSPEVTLMKILNGEINFQFDLGLANYPLLKENEEKGGYRVLPMSSGLGATVQYTFNLTYPDPVWQKIIRDKRFRIALSLGIDRKKINDTLFLGLARPAQSTINTASKFMEPEFLTAYAEYDPEKANQLLDEMGLDERDKEGWRLRPDGKRVTLPIDYRRQLAEDGPVTEMVVSDWRKLGIDASSKFVEQPLYLERQIANQIVCGAFQHGRAEDISFIFDPVFEIPYEMESSFAPLWTLWYNTEGKEGEEPPAEVKRLYELYEIMQVTLSEEGRSKAAKEILRLNAENLWHIGTVCDSPRPGIVARNLQNCATQADTWLVYNANQLFFEQ